MDLDDHASARDESHLPDFCDFFEAGTAESRSANVKDDLLPTAFRNPADHTIELVESWTTEQSLLSAAFKGSGAISRGDLFEVARSAREQPGAWTQLLIDTFAWGWGGTSIGPARLARVLEATEAQVIEDNLAQAVATLDSQGAIAAYWDLNNRSRRKVKHLGPAFFTKFLYFAAASGPVSAPRPLILDKVVAGRVNALIGRSGRLGAGGWTTRDYAFYLALMDRLAGLLRQRDGLLSWTPDAVELGIFQSPAAPPKAAR